jgi:hypothetical protein
MRAIDIAIWSLRFDVTKCIHIYIFIPQTKADNIRRRCAVCYDLRASRACGARYAGILPRIRPCVQGTSCTCTIDTKETCFTGQLIGPCKHGHIKWCRVITVGNYRAHVLPSFREESAVATWLGQPITSRAVVSRSTFRTRAI